MLSTAARGRYRASFAIAVQQRAAALQVCSDASFQNQPKQLPRWLCATRCPPSRHRLGSKAGSLMSYGADPIDVYRQAGFTSGDSKGREARRSAGRVADQVQTNYSISKPRRRSPHHTRIIPAARRPDDRIKMQMLRCMSLFLRKNGSQDCGAQFPFLTHSRRPAVLESIIDGSDRVSCPKAVGYR